MHSYDNKAWELHINRFMHSLIPLFIHSFVSIHFCSIGQQEARHFRRKEQQFVAKLILHQHFNSLRLWISSMKFLSCCHSIVYLALVLFYCMARHRSLDVRWRDATMICAFENIYFSKLYQNAST